MENRRQADFASDLTEWERFRGGSEEAERTEFEQYSKDIMTVQATIQERSGAAKIDRAQHAKTLVAINNARLVVSRSLPNDLIVGPWRPEASYPVTIRLSNASGAHQADAERDLRGAAIRIDFGEWSHDLLMTNFPVPHARDARQFMAFAKAMSGGRARGILKLFFAVGPIEAVRMVRNVSQGSGREVRSLAQESFWSRGAMLWGPAGPVRYFLRPVSETKGAPRADAGNPAYLSDEIATRLAAGDVSWELCIQRFVRESVTPVENAAREWSRDVAPPIVVAVVNLPQQDVRSPEAQATRVRIDKLAFNPWNTMPEFRPLGHLNRARKAVYASSAAHRAVV